MPPCKEVILNICNSRFIMIFYSFLFNVKKIYQKKFIAKDYHCEKIKHTYTTVNKTRHKMKKLILTTSLVSISLMLTNIANAKHTDKYICKNTILKTHITPNIEHKKINFTNWADYISPDIVPCFSRLANTEITYIYISDDNMTAAKIMTGSSGFDITEQGSLYIPREFRANALEEIDIQQLPNYKYINKTIYSKVKEINNSKKNYGLIYSYGTTGIAYNQDSIEEKLGKGVIPDSWDYVFDKNKLSQIASCGVSLLGEPEQIFGNYFFYKGIDPNTTDKKEYEKASKNIIKNIRPFIKYFDSNKYQNDFTAGDLCLVMGYSGDVLRSVERAKAINPDSKLHYVIPQEGTNIWFDMLLVPKNAKNKQQIYQFLNYMLEPYVMAMNSNYLYQPNAMTDNEQYLSPLFNDKNIKPTDEMIDKMYVLNLHTPEMQSFISKMWMNVKYGIDFEPKYYKDTAK